MAQFTVNPHRLDPYPGHKFRVIWDGRIVAGIDQVGALTRHTSVIEHRSGGEPSNVRKSPGVTTYEPVVLSRGVTHDLEFETWANRVWGLGQGSEVSLRDFRRDIRIELLNEAGQAVLAYDVFRCWVSEYVALPELDANAARIAIQSITVQNEGWVRDAALVEPDEPSGTPQATGTEGASS